MNKREIMRFARARETKGDYLKYKVHVNGIKKL